mgnify:CR=1 FL=1|tara:strand:- start:296 stop:838 length:543 start_codon:yes stop_codon:yes gene_type:complete
MQNVDLDFGNLQVAPCKHDDRYLVYSNGMLYNSKYEKFKRASENGKKSPYLSYGLYPEGKKGKPKKYYVHRLVAEHFLPNPHGLRDVHHIDSNPKNNNVSNLQWLSHQDNCRLKIIPRPEEVIKLKPDAYINRMGNKKNDYWMFMYQGRYAPKIKKYIGLDFEKAKAYRDQYFIDHFEVA